MQIEPPSYLNFILLQKGFVGAHAAIVHYNLQAEYNLQKAVNCRGEGWEGGGGMRCSKVVSASDRENNWKPRELR